MYYKPSLDSCNPLAHVMLVWKRENEGSCDSWRYLHSTFIYSLILLRPFSTMLASFSRLTGRIYFCQAPVSVSRTPEFFTFSKFCHKFSPDFVTGNRKKMLLQLFPTRVNIMLDFVVSLNISFSREKRTMK